MAMTYEEFQEHLAEMQGIEDAMLVKELANYTPRMREFDVHTKIFKDLKP